MTISSNRNRFPAPQPPRPAVLEDMPGIAPQEPDPPRPLVPSKPDEADEAPPVQSPLIGADHQSYERGLHVHRLLQLLPDLNQADWDERPGALPRPPGT